MQKERRGLSGEVMTCLCGNPVDGADALCARCAALRILELGADATEKEIKAAYHVLVKVWHPDRFQGDKALREAAEAKLKAVNSAYVFLCSKSSQAGRDSRREPESAYTAYQEPQTKTESADAPPTRGEAVPAAIPARSSYRWIFPAVKIVFKIAGVAFVLLLGRYLWIAFDVPAPSSDDAERSLALGKVSVLNELAAPKQRFLEAVEQDLRRLDPRKPAPETLPQAAEPVPAANLHTQPATPAQVAKRQPAKAPPAPGKVRSYITIGSTRDEVLEQQGTPTASSDDKLVYGRSELYLKDGSVIGWRIDPVSSPIRVKLWPAASVDPDPGYFAAGSTRDFVLAVQGTPTAFSENRFEYGGSVVYFQNNRVVSWKNDPASIPLRVQ
jgi:curved DNA-binding protein CbpA